MNITLVFFIYGLALYSLGLAMMLESNRTPLLADRRTLRPLAIFGLVQGSHEWVEMFINSGVPLSVTHSEFIAWTRILILAISFVALLGFAWLSFIPRRNLSSRSLISVRLYILLYALVVFIVTVLLGRNSNEIILFIYVFFRILLAVPGAIVAATALLFQANREFKRKRLGLGKTLRWAAVGFFCYGLTQIFVPKADFFPAEIINSSFFFAWTGVPIQLISAILAIWITLFILRIIQLIEVERQAQFQAAQQARADAVEQLRLELIEREEMRQDLMRHIVIAQEEERARIARELHDETSQTLTGFSLHLATLGNLLPHNDKTSEHLNTLKVMSKQIAESLYRMVHDLRPPQLDDLGLSSALHYLVDDINQRFRMKVRLEIYEKPVRVNDLVETVIFRIAQEALINVSRHAQTRNAEVVLKFLPARLELSISDNGVGFDPNIRPVKPHGWGLEGMRERAVSVGGELLVESSPGKGTTVQVIIPLKYKNNY